MNHYETLGVTQQATSDEIKAAFKAKAKQFHPDVNKDVGAEDTFKGINEAYEVLKSEDKRRKYDYALNISIQHQNDPFGDRFGWNRTQQRTNKHIFMRYNITLTEAFHGKETELQYNIPGSHKKETIKLIIPPSVNDGATFRFAGRGDNTIAGIHPGDLMVTIGIHQDPDFVRHGYDVLSRINVDFIDAMVGTTCHIPCIDGSVIRLPIMAGITQGSIVKIPDKGMRLPGSSNRGNMLVEVNMVQPILSEQQKEMLKRIKMI